MKLISYRRPDGAVRAGIVDDAGDVRDAGPSIIGAEPTGDVVGSIESVQLLPVSPNPSKIICVGLNYADHAKEGGQAIPERPILFPKFPNTLVAHGDPVKLPVHSTEVDYEAELGVIIGKRAKNVKEDEALDYVLGYTCLNDVSARDLQFAEGPKTQFLRGKSVDTFCPLGPWLVTADEISDPQILGIRCIVNGETLQDSNTKNMIFTVAEIIAFITEGITLEPGDVIATGTPAGVGFTRQPPIFLKAGDVMRVELDGIGGLENPVQ